MIIFYNIAAPVILSFYAGTGKTDLKSIGRKVITNPFLIGTLLGVIVSLLHLQLPAALEKIAAQMPENSGVSFGVGILAATGQIRLPGKNRLNGFFSIGSRAREVIRP